MPNNKSLKRDTEDAQADLEQEQGKIMQELGNKVMAVMEKYATHNGYALVLDVSNPQTPVLWAASAIDITNDIVKLYDQANPGTGAPSAAKPPAGSTAPVLRGLRFRLRRRGSEEEVTFGRGFPAQFCYIQRYNSVRGVSMKALAVVLSLTIATSVFGQAVHRNFGSVVFPGGTSSSSTGITRNFGSVVFPGGVQTQPVYGGAPPVICAPELASQTVFPST